MKKRVMLSALFISFIGLGSLNAQDQPGERYQSNTKGNQANINRRADGSVHVHQGVYIGLGLGPSFGKITDKIDGASSDIIFKGTGFLFDFRIGGPVSENLLLTFDMTSRAVSSPTIEANNSTYTTSTDVSLSENNYGAGLTYYMMPQNIYVGGTISAANYVITNSSGSIDETVRTDYGYSIALRGGKQWWISRNWGLGIGLIASYTHVKNKDQGMTENLTSPKLGVMAQFTFH